MSSLSPERQEYYRQKRERLAISKELAKDAEYDALFIHYYGASAYMTLVPHFKDMGVAYHGEVLRQLQKIRNKEMATLVNGIYLASGATESKKVANQLKRFLRELNK